MTVTKDNYLAEDYLGTAFLNSDRFNDAEAAFRRAINLKPDFNDAYFKLGNTLADAGKTDAALAIYYQLQKINPRYALADYNIRAFVACEKPGCRSDRLFRIHPEKKEGL